MAATWMCGLRRLFFWLAATVSVPATLYSGQPFFLSAWKRLKAASHQYGRADQPGAAAVAGAQPLADRPGRRPCLFRRGGHAAASCCWWAAIWISCCATGRAAPRVIFWPCSRCWCGARRRRRTGNGRGARSHAGRPHPLGQRRTHAGQWRAGRSRHRSSIFRW